MEKSRLKKGVIETIREADFTVLNLDGQCREIITFSPDDAKDVKDRIGKKILYFIEGSRLIHFELAEKESGLRNLYNMLPKEKECVIPA